MDIDLVGLTVTDPFIPNELLVTKFTENDQIKASINLWYRITANLTPKVICTFLENVNSSRLVELVKNFYFLSNIFDVMLDVIQTDSLLLLLVLLCRAGWAGLGWALHWSVRVCLTTTLIIYSESEKDNSI